MGFGSHHINNSSSYDWVDGSQRDKDKYGPCDLCGYRFSYDESISYEKDTNQKICYRCKPKSKICNECKKYKTDVKYSNSQISFCSDCYKKDPDKLFKIIRSN